MLQENNPDAACVVFTKYIEMDGDKEQCRILLKLKLEAYPWRTTPAKLLCEGLHTL